MKGVRLIILLLKILFSFFAIGQKDSTKHIADYVKVNGYVKNMQIFSFEDPDNIVNDNLIHNRLNFRFYPTRMLTSGLDFRNRIFTGETVKTVSGYGEVLAVDMGYLDMSWLLVNEPSLIFLTQIDRAWVNWANSTWSITIGRQRINWGINTYWNSNDLFNAYSLVDFDYEERPGADAVRVQRYFKNLSSFELAVKPGRDSSNWVVAAKYKFNKWLYDVQVIAGWWHKDIALGLGWAGNLKKAGLKGEATYFHPQDKLLDTSGVISASVSIDYVFKKGIFATGGFLLNSNGINSNLDVSQNLFVAPISSKNLMPTRYSGLLSCNIPLTPLLGASLVAIYSPFVNTAYFMPSVGYSVSNNWEIALFGQSFWMQTNNFSNIGNGIYIRLKGSF